MENIASCSSHSPSVSLNQNEKCNTVKKPKINKSVTSENMALYDIPEHLLNKLKCSLCYEYLSYPPITLYAETGSVCGRCPSLEAEKNVQPLREQSYENVASLLTFPCRYKSNGCSENLSMQQIPLHEQGCPYKPYFCPILPLGCCAWQGSPNELHGHFAMNHQIMLLDNPVFEFDNVNDYKEHYLIPKYDELFLLRTEFNNSDKLFRCSLYLIGKPDDIDFYEFEIIFSTGSDSEKVWTHPKKPVASDINLIDRTNDCIVELSMLKAVLEEPTIMICKINITKLLQGMSLLENILLPNLAENSDDDEDEEEEYDEKEVEDKNNFNTRNKFLEDIECPVCQEYMISPIFQCVTGHSVCGTCKPKLKECPTCRGQIGNTRNFTLEKIVENIEYNCKNKVDGCKFVGTSANIRKHELECKYRPNRCPLHETQTCEWMGILNKSYAHAKSAHPNCIQNNSIYETVYNGNCSRFEEFKLKSEYGQIFRIRYSYCNETQQVCCTVQCLAPAEDCGKFLYEINIIDCTKSGMELKSKKYCGSWGDNKDDIKHCTLWHLDMVKPFFGPNQMLRVKCAITKG